MPRAICFCAGGGRRISARCAWAKAGVAAKTRHRSRSKIGSLRTSSFRAAAPPAPTQPATKAIPPNGVTKPRSASAGQRQQIKRAAKKNDAGQEQRRRRLRVPRCPARAAARPPGPSPGHDTCDSARRFRTASASGARRPSGHGPRRRRTGPPAPPLIAGDKKPNLCMVAHHRQGARLCEVCDSHGESGLTEFVTPAMASAGL